jgi:hypothetical protein
MPEKISKEKDRYYKFYCSALEIRPNHIPLFPEPVRMNRILSGRENYLPGSATMISPGAKRYFNGV